MKPVMELLKQFFIQRMILYFVITFFSLFVLVPLGDLRLRFTDDHTSRCLLYSDIVFNVSATPAAHYFRIRFGEQDVCDYSIAVSAVFCLFYPLGAAVVYFYLYRMDSQESRTENKLDLSHIFFVIHIVLEVVMVILMLVSASLISAGFMHLCDSLLAGRDTKPPMLESCSDAQNFETWRGYDGSNFYIDLSVATAGGWFLFVSWLLQGALGVWKLWRLNLLPVIPATACCAGSE